MAQSKSRYVPAPAAMPGKPPWLTFLLIALGSAATGALGTYFILQPKLQQPAGTIAQPMAPAAGMSGPPLDLTAGVPVAQADRNLGNFYYDKNDWPRAIRYYESAIRQGTDDADIRTDLGNAYQFSGHPDEALAQYHLAQRMSPSHESSLFNQGGLYLERLNQPLKAVEIWNEYLQRFPQGQNATAARQLIAQASGHPTGTAPLLPATAGTAPVKPSVATPGPSNAEVENLLRLMPPNPAPAKP